MSRELTLLIFRLIVTFVVIAVQWYCYRSLISYVRSQWKSQILERTLQCLFVAFNIPLLLLVVVRPTDIPSVFVTVGVYPFYVWHGTSFFLFVLHALYVGLRKTIDLLISLLKKVDAINQLLSTFERKTEFGRWSSSRRSFLRRGMTILAGTTVVGTAYGVYAKNDYEICRSTIFLKNLPPEFEGFTITLVADIHSSVSMTKKDMVRYVDAINDIASDLVVIPGDFVNSMVEEVYPLAEAFSDVRARCGVLGSLGNHDFFTDVEVVAHELGQCGITLLRNECTVIKKDNGMIQILGVDDTGNRGRASDLYGRALRGTSSDAPRILLCHRPYFFKESVARNVDLTLAGHTHGGQVVFTKIGKTVIAPARLASPYVAGLYREGDAQMYVTRGLGTVGIPIRINCPPEITVITLRGKV